MADDISQHGHQAVTKAVRAHLSLLREQLQLGKIADVATDSVLSAVRQALNGLNHSSLIPVFNLTGIVLHSNLGRATLAESAITAMAEVASGASTLEYDIAEGKRGDETVILKPSYASSRGRKPPPWSTTTPLPFCLH